MSPYVIRSLLNIRPFFMSELIPPAKKIGGQAVPLLFVSDVPVGTCQREGGVEGVEFGAVFIYLLGTALETER